MVLYHHVTSKNNLIFQWVTSRSEIASSKSMLHLYWQPGTERFIDFDKFWCFFLACRAAPSPSIERWCDLLKLTGLLSTSATFLIIGVRAKIINKQKINVQLGSVFCCQVWCQNGLLVVTTASSYDCRIGNEARSCFANGQRQKHINYRSLASKSIWTTESSASKIYI